MRLLDVNVLLALAWPAHVHHGAARTWFDRNKASGWATCPITQAGFVRISSNPRIMEDAVSPLEALSLLQKLVYIGKHVFWPDDLDLTASDATSTQLLVGHRQVTDAYLLGLAISRRGTLVTLDEGVTALLPVRSPHRDAIEVISRV